MLDMKRNKITEHEAAKNYEKKNETKQGRKEKEEYKLFFCL